MKKANKILATASVLALALTLPQTAITSHASDYGGYKSAYGDGIGFMGDFGGGYTEGNCDNFVWPEPPSPSYNSYDDSSSSSSSYDSASSSSSDGDSSGGGSATVATPQKNPNDVTIAVAGGQKFRIVMNGEHTFYQVYHCGNSKVTLNVTNGNTNVVAYKTVTLEQGEDKLWYINITFAESLDTTGLVVNVTKGELSYLSTELGVSGIKINGTVALSTVPAEPEQTDEDTVIGHRYCVCGASFDIRENSGLDKDAWNAHAKEHADKGEAVRWTDK